MITNAEKYTERFEKDFQKLLVPDNSFYLNTKGISSTDLSVNIPQFLTQIAAPSDVTSNGALDVVEFSTDNKVVTQARFKTKAYQIVDYKEFFTANDQRSDCMDSMKDFIDTKIGDYAAYKIAPTVSGNTVYTTGTATRPSSLLGSGNTVKVISKDDMIAVRTLMAKSNLPGKWYGLIDADALSDLFKIDQFIDADKSGLAQSRLMNGEFADILGIRLFVRHASKGANVAYTTGGTLTDVYGAVGSATTVTSGHVGACIFWNENAMYANRGMAKFYTESSAIYQSDIMSMQYTYGLEKIRTDEVGTIALIEKK